MKEATREFRFLIVTPIAFSISTHKIRTVAPGFDSDIAPLSMTIFPDLHSRISALLEANKPVSRLPFHRITESEDTNYI